MGLSSVVGSLRVVFGADTAAFERGATEVERRAARIQRQFQGLGDRFTSIGRQMTIGLTAPLAAFGVAAARAASDAAELQSAFNVTFGDMAVEMNRWAEVTGDALGRSTQEIQRGANAFGLYFNQAAETRQEAARMSQQFTVLAQDLASFHNTGVDEALTALRSGLSGETEPLRRFGVFLNEAAVQAKALELGLVPVNGRLTDQQKIMARSAIILEATAQAQGDVIRTNDSAANTTRRLAGAWEELKVTLGEKLLPLVTPLIEKLNNLANRFASLSPQTQNIILVVAGLAAALGPLLIAAGAIVNAIGALIPLIAAAGGVMGGLAAAAGPVGLVIAAIAAAGIALYANWEKIGPVLEDLAAQFQAALGPPVRQMIAQLSATMTELWNGPFGELLRRVVAGLIEFEAAKLRIFGPAFIAIIGATANAVAAAFAVIGGAITAVSRLLDGDFSGAAQVARESMYASLRAIDAAFGGLPSRAIAAMQALVTGVRQWMVNALGSIWRTVTDRIEAVGRTFYNLYDAVVGHSYIPDMVDGIAAHMARLDAVMVRPATDAAERTGQQFADLRALLADLFPEAERRNTFAAQSAMLTSAFLSGQLSADEYAAAMDRLRARFADIGLPQILGEVTVGFGTLGDEMRRGADTAEVSSVRIVESFAQLAQGALSEIDKLVKGIRSGNILDIFSGLFGALDKIGGIAGGFNLGPFRFGQGLAGARANGGPVTGGRSYLVGERGPEIFTAPSSGRIISNDNMRGGGGFNVSVTPSPLFDVVVRNTAGQVVAATAPAIAGAGAQMGQDGMLRRASRVPA